MKKVESGLHGDPIKKTLPSKFHEFVYSFLIKEYKGVSSETRSSDIQEDVITLLGSSDKKFANAIGIGSLCNNPK